MLGYTQQESRRLRVNASGQYGSHNTDIIGHCSEYMIEMAIY